MLRQPTDSRPRARARTVPQRCPQGRRSSSSGPAPRVGFMHDACARTCGPSSSRPGGTRLAPRSPGAHRPTTSRAPGRSRSAHVKSESDQGVGAGGCGMTFRVERDVLADAVTWTARALPPRPPAPVLAGVRLEADASGTIGLSSFDYEVSARSEIPAEVSEPGTVLVSGRLLAEISRALPAKPVDVVLEGNKVIVTCG